MASAPARPPRFPPKPRPVLVMKNDIAGEIVGLSCAVTGAAARHAVTMNRVIVSSATPRTLVPVTRRRVSAPCRRRLGTADARTLLRGRASVSGHGCGRSARIAFQPGVAGNALRVKARWRRRTNTRSPRRQGCARGTQGSSRRLDRVRSHRRCGAPATTIAGTGPRRAKRTPPPLRVPDWVRSARRRRFAVSHPTERTGRTTSFARGSRNRAPTADTPRAERCRLEPKGWGGL
jgi:hypothetical protein